MTRRYGILLALVVAGAIAVAALARRPREARVAEAPAALPVTTLALRWDVT